MKPRTWALTFIIFGLFNIFLPAHWLIAVPVVLCWLFISIAISGFAMMFIDEKLDKD